MSQRGYVLPSALVTLLLAAALTAATYGHLASIVSGFQAAASHLRNAVERRTDLAKTVLAAAPTLGTSCAGDGEAKLCRSCASGSPFGAASPHFAALDYDRLFSEETGCREWRVEPYRNPARRTALSAITCTRLGADAAARIVSRTSLDLEETLELIGCDDAPCVIASAGKLRARELRVSGATIAVGGGGLELGTVSLSSTVSALPVPLIVDHPAGALAVGAVAPGIEPMTIEEARERGMLGTGGCQTLGFWLR